LTPRHNRPILWPARTVRKLVFMSATFSAEDLHDLGLEGRRVRLIDCGSPIDAEDRPVAYWPTANMGLAGQTAGLPALVARIRQVLSKHPSERGVIHTTYALATKLREALADEPRLKWHTPATAQSVYREWRRDPGPVVLVACGMTEGIDLPGDLCRWQIVTKLMFPDLTDPAVSAKRQARPEWYAWMPARDLQQAVGRSSRGPGDKSVVYVLDNSFAMLYSKHRDLFAPAFQAALHTTGVDFA
jgi:ATP-dependent DNA helicase DinG